VQAGPGPDAELLVIKTNWRKDGTVVITVTGELDINTAPRVRRRVEDVTRRVSGDVRLDVGKLRFCDAAGLAVITSAAERLRESGRQLHIDHASAQLMRVLKITELDHLAD
jgi:anti-sigma B factor antagonist